MEIILNPFEIDTIESNTPVCITMEDGSKYVAYQFKFENKTVYQTRDSITHTVEVEDNDIDKGDKTMKETDNKVLLKSYITYAKGSGGELRDYVVLDKNDTETLKSYYDDIVGDDVWGDFDSFLKGETITWAIYGDWDDPTGGEMFLTTYEQEAESILNGFNRQMKELNKSFGVRIEDYLTTTKDINM